MSDQVKALELMLGQAAFGLRPDLPRDFKKSYLKVQRPVTKYSDAILQCSFMNDIREFCIRRSQCPRSKANELLCVLRRAARSFTILKEHNDPARRMIMRSL